jgi:hypothetical protein
MKALTALLLVAFLAGCSPQKNLVGRLKSADRVVVTNTIQQIGMSFTNEDLEKLVQAISTAKKQRPNIDAAVAFKLVFYKGVQPIQTLDSSGTVFWIGQIPYADFTETIAGFYSRMRLEKAIQQH